MQIQSTLSNARGYEQFSYVSAKTDGNSKKPDEIVSNSITPFDSIVPLSQKAYQIFDKLTLDFTLEQKNVAKDSFNNAAYRYMVSKGIEQLDEQQIVRQFYEQFEGVVPDGIIASMLDSRISETKNYDERNFLTQFRDLLNEPTISLNISI